MSSAALLSALVIVGVWWFGRTSTAMDRPDLLWREQITEPGTPAGWRTAMGRPQVSGDLVAVTVGGQLTLLDRSSGDVDSQMEGAVGGDVALLENRVGVQTEAGVEVFDRDGLELVQGRGPRRMRGPMGGEGNVLLLRGSTSALLAMDVGREPPVVRWDAEIPGESGSVIAGPIVVRSGSGSDGGTVVISRGRQVTALALDGGSRRWTSQVRGPAAVGHLVSSGDTGMVYALDGQGVVAALDLADGSRRWSVGSVATGRAPHVHDGVMAVRMSDGRVAVFDAIDGRGPLWSTDGDQGGAGPVIVDDAVLVGDGTGLVGLDLDDGTERWSVQLLGPAAAISTAEGVGYVTVSPGIVYAVGDGQVLWRTIIGELASSDLRTTPVAGPSLVLVPDRDGTWRAIDTDTGRQRWNYLPDDPTVMSAPTVGPSGVYLTSDTDVIALNPDTGRARWRVTTGFISQGIYRPALHGDLLAAVQGPTVMALDPDDGEERWRHTFEARNAPASAAISDGAVYVTTRRGGLACLSAVDGQPRWQLEAGLATDAPPVVAGRRVIVAGDDGTVRAFDPDTGRATWRSDVPLEQITASAANGGTIHGLQDGNIVTAIDATSGRTIWTNDLPDDLPLSHPTVIRDTLIVATIEGTLIGIGPDGQEAWRVTLDTPVLSPPSASKRQLYILDVNGRVSALQ